MCLCAKDSSVCKNDSIPKRKISAKFHKLTPVMLDLIQSLNKTDQQIQNNDSIFGNKNGHHNCVKVVTTVFQKITIEQVQ